MFVFSNLAISLDGKIVDLNKESIALGTAKDRMQMQVLRKKADAILIGAKTLRVNPDPMWVVGAKKQPINIVMSASGKLPTSAKFWKRKNVVRLIFTTQNGLANALKGSKDRALVYACGKDNVNFTKMLKHLKSCGINKLLVEGGGEIMHSFLANKSLHELNVTLTPWCLGGRANPTLVGGDKALRPWSSLKLLASKRVGQELYLRYKVIGAKQIK